MNTGLLWFDDDPNRRLEEKVRRAAMHYERKYGRPPDLCFVNPSALENDDQEQEPSRAGRVEIKPGMTVLPHHFWLGVADGQAVQ
jgi:hypothetical protein